MKTTLIIVASCLSINLARAQALNSAAAGSTVLPSLSSYAVVSRDADSAVWQRQTYDRGPSGTVVTNTHRYVELATGLNHLVNGQYVPSTENIVISPDGRSAMATNGQHQVYFPGNIYSGDIKLVMPNGKMLQSQPIGLSYSDETKSVLLAVVTNSTGAILPSGNQVIYSHAFDGVDADLRYTYTKAGLEQDLVLRQQPPDPSALGLNPASTRLQMLTEFVSSPQPSVTAASLPTAAGNLENDSIWFGTMHMGQGKAFLLGTNPPSAVVEKRWLTLNGRQFLIEEVPVVSIATAIDTLPPFVAQTGSGKLVVSKNLVLPPQRLVHTEPKTRFLAQAAPPKNGLVLDYVTLNYPTNNCILQGDSTYYLSGVVTLTGTVTFEGGAVLKYAPGVYLDLSACSQINCLTAPYRPLIFTAMNDNSVGEQVASGSPSGYYASPAIYYFPTYGGTLNLSHFRIAYAYEAVYASAPSMNVSLQDGQIVNCGTGFYTPGQTSASLGDMLFANVGTPLTLDMANVMARNVTFKAGGYSLVSPAGSMGATVNLVNCILANFPTFSWSPSISLSGDHNGFYNNYAATFGSSPITTTSNPFQSVGAGNYYLTNGCAFVNAGTTNNADLTDLQTKTVFAPTLLTNVILSVNTALNPQAQRDTDAPDLGYHYDPIDYLVDQFWVTNAVLTVTNGAAIAGYNDWASIIMTDGSAITSIGTPVAPNWFAEYSTVQEQPVSLGPGNYVAINPWHVSAAPDGFFRFTKFACPGAGGVHLYDEQNNWIFTNLWIQDCEFWGGSSVYGGGTNTTATLINNLFARSTISTSAVSNSFFHLTNNLFWGAATVSIAPRGTPGWSAFNNAFDSCGSVLSGPGNGITNGYNAYLNCTNYLKPTNSTDIFTNSFAYQTSWFGTFYQPNNSPLIHMGNTNANLLGLHHYTVLANQTVEGTNIVSIGYHYVAADTNGNPLSTPGDGIPDYVADANGNGIVDPGEISWTNYYSINGLTNGPGLVVFTPLK